MSGIIHFSDPTMGINDVAIDLSKIMSRPWPSDSLTDYPLDTEADTTGQ